MSLSSSQRREQRRRLIVSWSRSSAKAEAPVADAPRSMAAYDPEAHPEKQRGPAVLLPTGIGGLAAAIVVIMLPLAAAVVASSAEHLFGRSLFTGGGRFARTVAAAGAVFDARGGGGLQAWLAQAYLFMAAGVALIVRVMRRHRRDDYKGRFRAWGWLAVVFVTAAIAGATPVGRLVAAAMTDATGTGFGPGGMGWWIALAAVVVVVAVSLWAVLPLHERLATGLWLTAGLAAWGVSATATWLADGRETYAAAGAAAWSLAAGVLLVAMLVAARSVIREVRGQCGVRKATAKPAKTAKVEAAKPVAESGDAADADAPDFEAVPSHAGEDSDTEYTDGSEHEHRHLSKAERKRLRKLARMNGAAA